MQNTNKKGMNKLAADRIKVLIVDDSALVRQFVKEILEEDDEIEVVGIAIDAAFAAKKIKALKPDVITLDIEMPGMDGLSFLEKLMKELPTPVVMLSSLTEKHAAATIKALELGAVDFITKPKSGIADGLEALREEITAKVKTAAKVRIKARHVNPSTLHVPPAHSVDEIPIFASRNSGDSTDTVIAIGASTGGTIAISDLLKLMPVGSPGIVIVQHMPEHFTKAYAERIDKLIDLDVREAENGDRVKRGSVLIARGGRHMLLQQDNNGYYVQIKDGPPVNRHIPSVEVLFRSTARTAGSNAIGVMLTGMGGDGAHGMREMRDEGAFNIAQSEESCVVFGMPRVAIEMGGVDKVVPINEMPTLIMNHDAVKKNSMKRAI
jgi:two-component system chemotaxis response regulator CheB